MNKLSFQLHSLHITLLLIITLALGSVGVGFLVQINPFIKSFDNNLYQLIEDGYHAKWIDLLISPFNYNFLPDWLSPAHMPSYFYFMIIFSLIYIYIFKRSLFGWAVLGFILGTILAQIISLLDYHFVFRARPFYALPNTVDDFGKAAWGKLSSYPSGHARDTTLYSTLIANYIPALKWILIIFILFIAYSRVYVGAHFPTDVLSAIIIGYLTAKVTLIISRELQIIFDQRKGGNHGKTPKSSPKDLQPNS